jgi:hypothetical protein
MKTIKIVDGEAYVCQEIEANCAQAVEYKPISYDAVKMQNFVLKRMKHCMDNLAWAMDHKLIVGKMDVDGLGQHIQFLDGQGFVTGSYEAMESLVAKLQPFVDNGEAVPATWLEENLTINEASQLFKACITHMPYWGTDEERLFAVVEAARRRQE